jgi:hypothetical protein
MPDTRLAAYDAYICALVPLFVDKATGYIMTDKVVNEAIALLAARDSKFPAGRTARGDGQDGGGA